MKRLNINRNKEGICFCHGLPTLKWKYCADIIRNAISNAGISTKSECQIPAINNVDKTILEEPTMVRVKSLKPYCLNSLTILSKRNIQTYAIDKATIT